MAIQEVLSLSPGVEKIKPKSSRRRRCQAGSRMNLMVTSLFMYDAHSERSRRRDCWCGEWRRRGASVADPEKDTSIE